MEENFSSSQYGFHETQELFINEDYMQKFNSCTKNPGHSNFHTVKSFKLEHLPLKYQDDNMYNCIKMLFKLTVLLKVEYCSPDRSHYWPGTKQSTPSGESNTQRFGTARIERVIEHPVHCDCQLCRSSQSLKGYWAEIQFYTASHVVCDQSEAVKTQWLLDYDDDDAPRKYIGLLSIVHVNIEKDLCKLRHVTHDQALVKKLLDTQNGFIPLWDDVHKRFGKESDKLTIIVSHPHGGPKRVSVGQWTEIENVGILGKRFKYNTCTCPGSSGAYVYFIGFNSGSWYEGYDQHVHSGCEDGLNMTGPGIFFHD